MRAYKFLDEGRCAPFTKTQWQPDTWVESVSVDPCSAGVHACLPGDLAYWVAAQLWEVELDGEVVESRHKLAAARGRLVRQIETWPDAFEELAGVSASRSRDRALATLASGGVADPGLAAASTLEELTAVAHHEIDDAYLRTAVALAADTARFRHSAREAIFVGACSSGHVAAGPDGDQAAYDVGYAAERAFQSAWLTARLQLAS